VTLEQKLASIRKKQKALREQERQVEEALVKERQDCEIGCACGATVRVGDVTLVTQLYGGYQPCGEGDWEYSKFVWFPCPGCHGQIDVRDLTPRVDNWPGGFSVYVAKNFDWYSDRERAPEWLRPVFDKIRAAEQAEARKRRLADARRVLAEVGE
jgi:hypothetical protein